jgi:hypothetical protein
MIYIDTVNSWHNIRRLRVKRIPITRVGTKVVVFVISRKFSRKLTFRFREIFVTKIRNFCKSFRENSEIKRHYYNYELKFCFLLFTSKKSANIFFVMPKQFLKIQYLNIIYYCSFGTFYLKVLRKVFAKSFAKFL